MHLFRFVLMIIDSHKKNPSKHGVPLSFWVVIGFHNIGAPVSLMNQKCGQSQSSLILCSFLFVVLLFCTCAAQVLPSCGNVLLPPTTEGVVSFAVYWNSPQAPATGCWQAASAMRPIVICKLTVETFGKIWTRGKHVRHILVL